MSDKLPKGVPSNWKQHAKIHTKYHAAYGGKKCACRSCRHARKVRREQRLAKVKGESEAASLLLMEWQARLARAAKKVGEYAKKVRRYQKVLEEKHRTELAAAKGDGKEKIKRHITLE